MLADLGLTVTRSIPMDALAGLASGAYTAHGGVVRDSLGRIISHLAVPSSTALSGAIGQIPGLNIAATLIGNAQIAALSKTVEQVLSLTMVNTALSGLGLATSIVGFPYLASRISTVDKKVDALGKQTKEIKQILQSQQKSRLLGAVDDYKLASEATDAETRRHLLVQAQRSFGELAHHYKAQVGELSSLPEVEAAEGYFVIACLGNAICTSDLGMGAAATDRLEQHRQDWLAIARQQCLRMLQLDDPGRYLDPRYIESLPSAALVQLLDFAHGAERGIGWIDELRRSLGKATMFTSAVRVVDKPVIEYAKSLKAKGDVLGSYVSHFGFLSDKRVSATAFSNAVEAARVRENAELVWVA